MFEFSENDYKWCVACGGNIRSKAFFCRYCKAAVGSKILSRHEPKTASPTITNASHWLPAFSELVDATNSRLAERIAAADAALDRHMANPTYLKPGVTFSQYRHAERNASVCPPHPPTPAELGLILDILLSARASGVDLTLVCQDKRLQLLQITPQTITEEAERRLEEIREGIQCPHCREHKLQSENVCRHCKGTAAGFPHARGPLSLAAYRYDESLLRSILTWEEAHRQCNSLPLLNPTILSNREISAEQVMKLKATMQFDPFPPLPKSQWRERMLKLGIEPDYYANQSDLTTGAKLKLSMNYYLLDDIISLAGSLVPSFMGEQRGTAEEALIVYQHAIDHWSTNPNFNALQNQILSGKALALSVSGKHDAELAEAQRQEDCARRDRLNKLGNFDFHEDGFKVPPLDPRLSDSDPEVRLAALEEIRETMDKRIKNLGALMNSALPELANVFDKIAESATGKVSITERALQAQIQSKKGNHLIAKGMYEQILKDLEDDSFEMPRTLMLLAEEQVKLGEQTAAETNFHKAIDSARNLDEAHREEYYLVEVEQHFASHLLHNTDRFEEALSVIEEVLSLRRAMVERLASQGAKNLEKSLVIPLRIKASILQKLNRPDQTRAVENEIQRISNLPEADRLV